MKTSVHTSDADPAGRAETLFFRALELPEEERTDYLLEQCHGDPVLRAEVEDLLERHGGLGGFLNTGTPHVVENGEEWRRFQPERAGGKVGPYKLLQQIGEGGFGVVWMAEQEAPVRRRVALKIVKPGMDIPRRWWPALTRNGRPSP